MSLLFSALVWYCFLAFVVLVLQQLTRCFTRFNIFTVVFGFFLIRHGITVPFDDDINLTFANIVVSENCMIRFHISLYLAYLSMLGGIFMGYMLFGGGAPDLVAFKKSQNGPIESGANPGRLLIVSAVVMLLIAFYQIDSQLNIVDLVTGNVSAEQYRDNRETSGSATHFSVGPLYRLAAIARIGILPLLVATLYLLRKRDAIWSILFWGTTGIGVIAGVLSGQKTPAILLLLTIIGAAYLRRGDLRISRVILPAGTLALLLVFIGAPTLYKIQYPQLPYEDRLQLTFHRLTSEYDRSLQLYFEIYPDIKPHTHGMSSTLIRSIFGGKKIEMEPERFIPTYYLGNEYKNTWNAAYIGQAWTDWGYYGVAGVSLGFGLLLQAYAAWFRRANKTALTLGTQVALMIASIRLSEVGYTAAMLSYGLVSSFLVYIFIKESKNAI